MSIRLIDVVADAILGITLTSDHDIKLLNVSNKKFPYELIVKILGNAITIKYDKDYCFIKHWGT